MSCLRIMPGKLFLRLVSSGIVAIPILANLPALAAEKTTALQLTPEELAERVGRLKCKIEICKILVSKQATGSDIACPVTKTWRKVHIEKQYLKNKISWPWGNAKCTSDIGLKRAMLFKAVSTDSFDFDVPKHNVSCKLLKKDGKSSYDVSFTLAPKVKWQKGKANKVVLNMNDLKGPMLVKGGIWSITKFNNLFGVLNNSMVEKINEFIDSDCPAVLKKHTN